MELTEHKERLAADIEETRDKLRALEAAYAALDKGNNGGKTTVTGVRVISGQFTRMRVGRAVIAYLRLKREPATIDELVEALTLGGYEWPTGKSPQGNIRRSLPWNKELKEIGGLIYLNKKET